MKLEARILEHYGNGKYLLSHNYYLPGDVVQIEGQWYRVEGEVLPYHNNYTGRFGWIHTLIPTTPKP